MTYNEITSMLQDATISALAGLGIEASRGLSNQSCSAYVVVAKHDEDGDTFEEFKIRFSDHADRYGSDATIRIDGHVDDEFDAGGEWVSSSVAAWKFDEMVDEAVSLAVEWING